MCVDITKTFFTQNVVVQKFESHGIRTLARATRRQNFSSNEKYHQQKVERPLIPDDINIKEVMEEDRAKNRGYSFEGHKNYLAAGDAIYTEGNFVTWDIHAPASVKMEIEKILGEHNDVIKFSILGRLSCRRLNIENNKFKIIIKRIQAKSRAQDGKR